MFYKFLGINDDWELHSIPIMFQHLGGSHTGDRIKVHYDNVGISLGIKD